MRNALTALVVGMTSLIGPAVAQAPSPYTEGMHYTKLKTGGGSQSAATGVVSVEVGFSYDAPFSYRFENLLARWTPSVKESSYSLSRLPLNFNMGMPPLQKTYYTIEALDLGEAAHKEMFDAIHQKRARITDANSACKTLESFVPQDICTSTFNSFGVKAQANKADAMARSYGVSSAPIIIIDGTYSISSSRQVNLEDMLKIADHLIAKQVATAQAH